VKGDEPARSPGDRSGQTLTLHDGRTLGYGEFGDPLGRPVILCHGLPASRLDGRLGDAAARRVGVRLVAPDRPGYGYSTFQAARRMVDWPLDVETLADHLGFDRFAVLGVSGGAPYAVACAARLGNRVSAVGVVCGLGRVDTAGSTTGMRVFSRASLALARHAPRLSHLLNCAIAPALRANPAWITKLLAATLPAPDAKILSDPEVLEMYSSSFREALRQGGRGAAVDLALHTRRWEADVQSIRAPFYLWHGEVDSTVPVSMGRKLASEVPGCRAMFLPDEGHFSLPVNRIEEILRTLSPAPAQPASG
jgi:pimeloyl-ACP methyl ester carboxylesterase